MTNEPAADPPTERGSTPLDQLAEQWLDTTLDLQPELRVWLGRPGREGEYGDYSPDGPTAFATAARETVGRVRREPPIDGVDEVTKSELLRTIELALDHTEAGLWKSDVKVISSPAQGIREIFDLAAKESTEDWEIVDLRLRNVPKAINGYLETLRQGIRDSHTPAIRQVEAVARQADDHASEGGFFDQLAAEAPPELSAHLARSSDLARTSYRELAEFLRTELAGHARTKDAVGRETYQLLSRDFIGAEVDLDETYAWGIEELHRMAAEQETIADRIRPGASVREAIQTLEEDPSLKLHGTKELQAWMQATSDEAIARLNGTNFDIPEPLQRLECHIAPTHEGGIYYTPPSEDFSRAGRMWWSVPASVTEFDTWREKTTVYHEGIPGHHLQIGLAMHHRHQLNSWRRINWNSGHGEGWALYAERLMDELGYLTNPADRLGMLDGQRMRAARVVVDIGVHLELMKPNGSGPWTGDDALPFVSSHVNMPAEFVEFEVLRYLGWAGQAPSYKVGQRLWEQLRDDWLAQNPGAQLKQFHSLALAPGSVGLGTLRNVLLGG